jgi:hypothetical protein
MKTFVSIVVALLVGLGLGYFIIPHPGESQRGQMAGGIVEIDASKFVNGFYAGESDQFSVNSAGVVSTTGALTSSSYKVGSAGSSSSSPAALGSATAGKFIIAASATTAQASTTALSLNSLIFLQQSATTTIPGTTCNTAVASGTIVTTKVPGNGFHVRTNIAPTTNPFCYDFISFNQ